MKKSATLVLVVSMLLPFSSAIPQEKATKEEAQTQHAMSEGPQLRVRIVFSEFEGEKKVKSLPYTLLLRAPVSAKDNEWARIRMGSRVPITIGGEKASTQIQYLDIGTNIDCKASQGDDGSYRLTMNLERSWAEGRGAVAGQPAGAGASENLEPAASTPVIRQFKSENIVSVRDGQTLETSFATDPFTGKVIRLEVTVNVLK
jgi:hypothetical protein